MVTIHFEAGCICFLLVQTEGQAPGWATGSRKAQSPMMPKRSPPPRVGCGLWLPWPGPGAQNRQPWLDSFLWLWPYGDSRQQQPCWVLAVMRPH